MAQTFIPDAFKSGKVLASNPRMNHAAALFGTDGKNYIFKDSGPGFIINTYCRIKYSNIFLNLALRKNSESTGRRV